MYKRIINNIMLFLFLIIPGVWMTQDIMWRWGAKADGLMGVASMFLFTAYFIVVGLICNIVDEAKEKQ